MNNILGGETVMARFWSDLVSSFKCYLGGLTCKVDQEKWKGAWKALG